jgi:hypothetical protein
LGPNAICDQCIEDRLRRLRRVAVILPSVLFLVLLGIGLGSWLIEGEVGAIVALGTMAVLFGPVLAPVLLWQIKRNPDFGRERTGFLYATRTKAKEIKKQGYTHFWTAEDLLLLATTVPEIVPGAASDGSGLADYSFVRNATGAVTGIWLRDPAQARSHELLLALLLKHGEPGTLALGGARVVSNTHDASGGTFVMFGGAKAPGEI